jgi:hypothetical protein
MDCEFVEEIEHRLRGKTEFPSSIIDLYIKGQHDGKSCCLLYSLFNQLVRQHLGLQTVCCNCHNNKKKLPDFHHNWVLTYIAYNLDISVLP